jgi:MFS family permease
MPQNSLTRNERRATFSLASIFAFRMLGLFMIYPVFAFYATKTLAASSVLIGVALGIYGLAQACLQIPFGMLSDKIGRKPVIAFGLCLFLVGSLIAGFGHSMTFILVGRTLQGTGAVGSTVIAMLSDLTRDEVRTKAMAIVGMIIGLSFTVAIILGPSLYQWFGIPGLFNLTALFALLGLGVLFFVVPAIKTQSFHYDTELSSRQFASILRNPELLRLDFGVFCLHAILTANFIVLPHVIHHLGGINIIHQWKIYLPVLALAFVGMVPMVIISEKKRQLKSMFVLNIVFVMIAQLGLWEFHLNTVISTLFLWVFFTAFIFLEATLPSLVSKVSPPLKKGTAIGFYSSAQFFGAFMGGIVGGCVATYFGNIEVFLFGLLAATLWLFCAITMTPPRTLSTVLCAISSMTKTEAETLKDRLLAISGVYEVGIVPGDHTAYCKVDRHEFDEEAFHLLINK